ncbi:MAG TPA: DUF2330 domain-containing protein [Ktedonobacteraceae bacterium]
MRKKLLLIPILAFALFIFQTGSAFACGGLIAPDGDVRLGRASTLIAWHNGVEHYLTSFSYQGSATNVGWIVPLPAVPDKIEDGGAWTLQRLNLESHPAHISFDVPQMTSAQSAQVLQQVQVEALNVTVIKGSGKEIVNWAVQNGFFLDEETHDHLLVYAQASPIFMAAKYDTHLAEQRHQQEGDGVPLLITMKTTRPWVPLEVLALGAQQVEADLYFLTDMPLNISDLNARIGQSAVGSDVPGASGLKLAFQEKLSTQLYHDLSTDRNMSWVWPNSWFTYLSLDAPSPQVTYDLSVNSAGVLHAAPFGTSPMAANNNTGTQLPGWIPTFPMNTPQWAEGFLALAVVVSGILFFVRRRARKAQRLAKTA